MIVTINPPHIMLFILRATKSFCTLLIFLSFNLLYSASTGKISGTVVDAETQEKLSGVNIIIDGTTLGTATDVNGHYVILQIPPGIYTVSSHYIGYAKLVTKNIRVSTDLTTKLDFEMSQSTVEGDQITVIAEKPLFERSATNEVRIIRSEQLTNLPIRGYENVASMQTGVVVDDEGEMHVRGGRRDETAFYIDGVYVNNPYNLGRAGNIPNIAMEEVSMQIGGFGAEYGDANAGIVNVTSKTGGEKLQFSLEGITDKLMTSTPSVEKPLAYSYGYNLLSGSVSGPVPTMDFIRFFGAFEIQGMDDANPGNNTIPYFNGELNYITGLPENGEPFVDENGNYLWDWEDTNGNGEFDLVGDSYESFTDSDEDGEYDAPDYLLIDSEDIEFKYGPKDDNWVKKLNFNGNILIDLAPLINYSWKLKLGGNYYNSHRSLYSHARSLFAFYNDASTSDGIGVTGALQHRYNQSESITNTMYAQLRGNIPGMEKMFFNAQISRFSDWFEQYDPVFKEGYGSYIYDDGTISGSTLPYLQMGKDMDLSNPVWIYSDTENTESNFSYWIDDTNYTFVRIDYDTTWINPLYTDVGIRPSTDTRIANYTVAGYNSASYSKDQSNHITFKGSLIWQLGAHELKTGGEIRNNTIRFYRMGRATSLTRYFFNNPPYSPTQDRWGYDASLETVVSGESDNIPDYLQDGSDTWDPDNDAGDPYFGQDGIYGTDDDDEMAETLYNNGFFSHSSYIDDFIFQGYKSAFAENLGYDITGKNEVDSGLDKARKPVMASWFLQDKYELEDLIMTLGIRYDYINPKNKIFNPETGGNQNIIIQDDGTIAETVYWNDADGDSVVEVHEYTAYAPTEDDSTGLPHRIDAYKNNIWSPRIGLAFPVTDKTVFHAQYGKYVQQPELNRLFISYTRFLSNLEQGNFTVSANPELKPVKTTAYEIGFKQLISNNISIDATVFYKQMSDYIQIRNVSANPTGYALYVNGDYATVKGLSLSMHTKRINRFQVDANYTLQFAGGTGSNSTRQFTIAWLGGNFPTFVSPLEFDQRHTGNLSVDYRIGDDGRYIKNTGLNVLFRFGSGLRYTPSKPRTEVFGGSLAYQPTAGLNAGVLPWTFQFDLKMDKSFSFAGTNMAVFVWVENVLDNENVTGVYNSTGLPDNDGYLNTSGGETWLETALGGQAFGEQLYKSRISNPGNYGAPRQIRIGIRLDY